MDQSLFVILIVVVGVIAISYFVFPDQFKMVVDKIKNTVGMKDERMTSEVIGDKLVVAENKVIEEAKELVSQFIIPSSEDMKELENDIALVDQKIHVMIDGKMDAEKLLEDHGAENLIHEASKWCKKMLIKAGHADAAVSIEHTLMEKIEPEIDDILHATGEVSNPINEHSSEKRDKNDLFNRIWKNETGQDVIKGIEMDNIEMNKAQKQITLNNVNEKDPLAVLIAQDNPSLYNNALTKNLMPTDHNNNTINLELETVIASQNKFNNNGLRIIKRNRGGDTRPIPKAMIDQLMTQGNSRDPNSLQRSTKYEIIDILETGRGESGNEYLDLAIDYYHKKNDKEYLQRSDQIAQNNLKKYGSLNDVKDATNMIINDIKFGKMEA